MMGWLVLGLVLLLSAMNVPIGFVLAIATIVVVLIQGTAPLAAIPLMIFGGASKFPLLAIPLFILAGGLMTTTGISTRLINLASALVGFIRGGLAMVTIVASMFFGRSPVGGGRGRRHRPGCHPGHGEKGIPQGLQRRGGLERRHVGHHYPPEHSHDHLCRHGGHLGGEALHLRGHPGIIGGGLMMVLSYYFARTRGYPAEAAFSLRGLGRALKNGFWALMIPVVIWGGSLVASQRRPRSEAWRPWPQS